LYPTHTHSLNPTWKRKMKGGVSRTADAPKTNNFPLKTFQPTFDVFLSTYESHDIPYQIYMTSCLLKTASDPPPFFL
jgi:hypothetical protein